LDDVLPEFIYELERGAYQVLKNIHGQIVPVTIYPPAWAAGALHLQGKISVDWKSR
jgi:hypothetical protein